MEDKMVRAEDLEGKIYMTCSACMSVLADGLSWANAHKEKIAKRPQDAKNIAVLSCQVTDLAVLNDLRTIERLKDENPGKRYFVSGCLAKRPDIGLPSFVERLETPRKSYQFINDRSLIGFEKPFWIKEFNETDGEFRNGHLFREMYPLRIGKGCPNKCSYCTIRVTRGAFESYSTSRLEEEFLAFDNVLLVADSPTAGQIKEWSALALKNKKGFSIRNVEPSVTVACKEHLFALADKRLLKVYHSPIQSSDAGVLKDMNRNVESTIDTMRIAGELKKKGVYVATNIIIDYKGFDQNLEDVYSLYDYVSWNPLWDRKWDRKKAESRFENYFGAGAEKNPALTKIRELEKKYGVKGG